MCSIEQTAGTCGAWAPSEPESQEEERSVDDSLPRVPRRQKRRRSTRGYARRPLRGRTAGNLRINRALQSTRARESAGSARARSRRADGGDGGERERADDDLGLGVRRAALRRDAVGALDAGADAAE